MKNTMKILITGTYKDKKKYNPKYLKKIRLFFNSHSTLCYFDVMFPIVQILMKAKINLGLRMFILLMSS